MSNFEKRTKRASEEIDYDKNHSEPSRSEVNEQYLRRSWDRTIQERDDLKAQVMALSAAKKGLETSLKEAVVAKNSIWNEGYIQGHKDRSNGTGDNFHLNPYSRDF